jgi:hypothetical protein
MTQETKTIEPKRQFTVLLLCYYSLPVLQDAWNIANSINYPSNYWERFLFRNGDIIEAMFRVLFLYVPIMFFRIKEYNTDKRYKIGLLLMMLKPISSALIHILKRILPEILSGGLEYGVLLINIIAIVGLFLFINASPVDRKVNVFVKCTPFIPSVLLSLWGVILVIVPTQQYYPYYNSLSSIGSLAVDLALLITLVLLLRKK